MCSMSFNYLNIRFLIAVGKSLIKFIAYLPSPASLEVRLNIDWINLNRIIILFTIANLLNTYNSRNSINNNNINS